MDAATRAELDALRLRAYGRSPDIADDPVALARLVALEELAMPVVDADGEATVDSGPGGGGEERLPPADAAPSDARVVAVRPAPAAGSRRGWHAALIAVVAMLTVPLGIAAALQSTSSPEPSLPDVAESVRESRAFSSNPDTFVLITLRIDRYFGEYTRVPDSYEIPEFPTEGLLEWAEPLGDYYGWQLWLGGATDDEKCLLLTRPPTTRADCVTDELEFRDGVLVIAPFEEIPQEERPDRMTSDESLGFWWGVDGTVKVLLGPTPAD